MLTTICLLVGCAVLPSLSYLFGLHEGFQAARKPVVAVFHVHHRRLVFSGGRSVETIQVDAESTDEVIEGLLLAAHE